MGVGPKEVPSMAKRLLFGREMINLGEKLGLELLKKGWCRGALETKGAKRVPISARFRTRLRSCL